MLKNRTIQVAIGFATGRKSFKNVIKTYISSWKESGLLNDNTINLNLFVAYDTNYQKTKVSDYTKINKNLAEYIDVNKFIGKNMIKKEIEYLADENVITINEANMIFGKGYAA